MSNDILGIVRDVFVIGYMFVLRIGVPILITLMIGAWLKRMLEEKEEQPATATFKAGQHCWDVKQTSDTVQAKTLATQRPDLPCWLALQVQGTGMKEMCYACPVYTARVPVPAAAKA